MENNARKMTLCCWSYGSGKTYPNLHLKGKWLEQFGFTVGAQVTIENPKPGQMIITETTSSTDMQIMREKRDHGRRLLEIQKAGKKLRA
jgi:hypothetical protein